MVFFIKGRFERRSKEKGSGGREREREQENIIKLKEEVHKIKEENTRPQGQLEKANSNIFVKVLNSCLGAKRNEWRKGVWRDI